VVTLDVFAAAVRAPTPSAAAELAVPDGTQLPAILDRLRDRASAALLGHTAERKRELAGEARALVSAAPDLGAARQRAADLLDRGHRALGARLERHRATLDGLRDGLRALGPAATLARGYAVARLPDGTIVREPAQAPIGERLDVVIARGVLGTRVEDARTDGGEELLR
jgi:exodeoxyribonuclease VII large subunit